MKVKMQMKKRIDAFSKALDERRFYDAHEELEVLWFPHRFEENNAEMQLLKGFINAAVSFELLQRGRRHASNKVWKNYLKYRQLLFCIDSPHKNNYYQLMRKVDALHITVCNLL